MFEAEIGAYRNESAQAKRECIRATAIETEVAMSSVRGYGML